MSLKKGLLFVLITLLMLIPLAQLLRTQNPWNCFNFTYDESYFLQATLNEVNGQGYRTYDQVKAFDPLITVGIPMAWGARSVQKIVGLDLGHSGRIWVHLSFYALLLTIAGAAYRRSKNWIAPLFALVLFSLGIRGIPYGSYFTYGYLSEIPAILLGALSLFALDRKKTAIAGVLAVACFIMKPTFLLFIPAIGLAALMNYGRKGLWAGLTIAVSLVAYWVVISEIREQSLISYLQDYWKTILQVSLTSPNQSIFSYYEATGWVPAVLTLGALASGAFTLLPFKKSANSFPASRMAIFFFLTVGICYYLVTNSRPVEKQWGAILCLVLVPFSIHWGTSLANRFQGALPQQAISGIFLAVMLTWLINIPPSLYKQFIKIPENSCPSKEQRYIGRELRGMVDQKKIERKDLGVLISSPSFNFFLYELGWNPAYREQWKDLGTTPPKFVVGQVDRLLPAPAGCSPYWMGSSFGMLKCGK